MVNDEARRAKLANGLVVFDKAGCIAWAREASTRIHAIEINASLVGRTASILEAD